MRGGKHSVPEEAVLGMETGSSARQWAVVAVLLDGARARALYVVSMLSYVRGEVDRTVEAVEESIAAALLGRGLTALSGGDLDAAEKPLRKALEMFREQDERSGASLGLVGLAQVELARGATGRVAALLAEAEGLSRSAGDWFTLTAALSSQALESRLHGDEARTAALLRESVGLAGNLGDAWHVV